MPGELLRPSEPSVGPKEQDLSAAIGGEKSVARAVAVELVRLGPASKWHRLRRTHLPALLVGVGLPDERVFEDTAVPGAQQPTAAGIDEHVPSRAGVEPLEETALADTVRAKGGLFVECPVGGTVGPARQGKLLGVAGAAKEDFEKAKPLLEQMCRRVDLVGPVGAGTSLKLALNLPLLVYYQALAEAYVLCRHLKLDNKWLMEFLSETSGAPNVLKTRWPKIAAALTGGDMGPTASDIDTICKDLATMLAEGKVRGVTLPLVEKTLAVYDEAVRAGWGKRDAAALPAYWPSRATRPGEER